MSNFLKELMSKLKIEAIAGIYFFICLSTFWSFGCTTLTISALIIAFVAFAIPFLYATAE